MRKLLGILFCALVVAVCGCGGNEKENVYDQNLKFAFEKVKWSNTQCGHLTDLAVSNWNMALGSGNDANAAIKALCGEGVGKSFADGIKLDKQRIDSVAKLLADTPDDRKDSYNDFITLVSELNTLSGLALKPSGSLYQYSNNVSQQKMKVTQLLDQFSMKYANILNEKEK